MTPRARDQEIFDRYPGLYMAAAESDVKAGKATERLSRITESLTHDEVRSLARAAILADPTVTVFVYSQRNQHYMFWYDRENLEDLMREEEPLLPGIEPVEPAVDPVEPVAAAEPEPEPVKKERKKPGNRFPAVRGRALQIGTTEGWPPSRPAQLVKEFFTEPGRVATTPEIVQALGSTLTEMGMQHPSALIRRLKREGFLVEVL